MKKSATLFIIVTILALILLPVLTACDKADGSSGGTDRLVIYNWEDYIDTDMCDDFAAYYKEVTGRSLSITYTTFDTNETMLTKVLKGDANVDLICPSEYAIEKLLRAGCILNHSDVLADIALQAQSLGITFDGMSSLGNGDGNVEPAIMDVIRSMFGAGELKDDSGNVLNDASGKALDMTEYMVPYFWGTLGILYNTSVITSDELDEYGWGVLWNVQQNQKLENKILMKDSVRDSYAAAVFYMYEYGLLPEGYEDYSVQSLINCTDDAMLEAAKKVLTEQRDHISGYEVDFGKDDMINEIVYADLAWSGDAMYAIEEGGYDEENGYQLDYYVPSVASNIWYDGWVIPTTVNNKLAAMMFIDYMCDPMNGIRNSMEVGYTSAVAKEILSSDEDVCDYIVECYSYDEDGNPILFDDDGNQTDYDVNEFFGDKRRYPTINATLGVMRDFGAQNDALVQMWQQAKSGSGVPSSLWWCLLAIILAVGAAIGVYFLVQALKRRPRKISANTAK